MALLQEIGIIYTDLWESDKIKSDREQAEHWLGRSISVAQLIGDEEGKSIALSHRGRATLASDPQSANADFQEALMLAVRVGRRSTEGRALKGFGESPDLDRQSRITYLSQAKEIFGRLGMLKELESCDRSIAMLSY